MNEILSWEYEVLKHYHRHSMFGRRGLVSLFLDQINENLKKSNRDTQQHEFGLNDNQIVSVLQIGLIAHIMMFIEDLAVISKAIKGGTVDYYSYLDKKDEDLGKIIGEFYDEIIKSDDKEIRKILSYVEVDEFDFKTDSDNKLVDSIINENIKKAREFFQRIDLFRHNHIKIFRRYKHAGFPIIFGLEIPKNDDTYKDYQFMSVAFTSKETLTKDLAILPFSNKVLNAYENLLKDIFAFLGLIILNKLMCIERNFSGMIPTHLDILGLGLAEKQRYSLERIVDDFEKRYPKPLEKKEIGTNLNAEYMEWYVNLDKYSKSSFK